MSIGLFTYLLETYVTMSDVHIATALCSLVSLLSLNVRVISICIMFANISHLASHEIHDDTMTGLCKFRCQLLHSSLAKILESLKPGMMTPEVVHFPDGHFRRVVYELGPYITDCYDFSYFVLFTYVFSLFLEVSHGTATLTHFSLTHIAATLLTHSIAILIALPHWCSIYSGQSCRLFFS